MGNVDATIPVCEAIACLVTTMGRNNIEPMGTETVQDAAPRAAADTPPQSCNTGKGIELSSLQKQAVEALVEGRNANDAAVRLGITKGTLRRWLKQPEFQAALEEASDPTKMLKCAAPSAVRTLIKAQRDPSPAIRVKAATAILKFVRDDDEYERIDERMSLLEEILKKKR